MPSSTSPLLARPSAPSRSYLARRFLSARYQCNSRGSRSLLEKRAREAEERVGAVVRVVVDAVALVPVVVPELEVVVPLVVVGER